MAVRKVNPEVGPVWRPTQAPLYQAPEPQQPYKEGEPESLGLPGRVGGGCPPPGPPVPRRAGSDGVSSAIRWTPRR